MIDGIVWKQKKRKRRLVAQAEEDREKRRVGRRQDGVECMRALKITERGRIVKARTPSGRKHTAPKKATNARVPRGNLCGRPAWCTI